VEAGGLHIIGTERHDARRIDNQLRGRAGRQGDPGSSRFYLSLEDTLMKRFASDRVAGLMERMGLEGDVAIESRLVSRTIENAQSRVEGYNFDIRKRVVEYDDVINKQRETIYAERDKVLHNEDLTETVRSFLDEEVEALVDQTLGPVVDDWDLAGLATAVDTMDLVGDDLDADSLAELGNREAILERLREAVDETLEAKEREHGADTWGLVERLVLLRTIDSLWVEHLTELDDFRRGVGLRGYGGTDPLNEFKREAFKLWDELRGFIRHGVATTIFRVSVQRQAPPPPEPFPMTPIEQEPPTAAGNGVPAGTATAARAVGGPVAAAATSGRVTPFQTATGVGGTGTVRLQRGDETVGTSGPGGTQAPAGPKLGRNDPCFCGSGKKYKKCHGA
jgi:preprotein translocase subunit SecA